MKRELIKIERIRDGMLKITIHLKPIPWSAPVISRRGAYSKHSSYKKFVKTELTKAYNGPIFTGPLRCDMKFYLPNKSKLSWHVTKPDRINLAKVAEDFLEGIFFKNDSCIIEGDVQKIKDTDARTEIFITEI